MAEVITLTEEQVREVYRKYDKEALINLIIASDMRIRDLQKEIKESKHPL